MRIRRAIAAVALIAAIGFALFVFGGLGSSGREVRATFGSATNVVEGLEVRVAGRKVGSIATSEYENGEVILRLRIDDESIWPLRRGTEARLRFGTTAGNLTRYVELAPGPPSAATIPEGGLITRANTVTPVEFDDVFKVFDTDAREDLKGLLANTAATVRGRAPALRRGIRDAVGGFDALGGVMADLGADSPALRTLVGAAARTAGAVARRDAQLRDLLGTSGATFDELGSRASAIEGTLQRLPGSLRVARGTLARAERSLAGLEGLVSDLRPGARRLVELVPSAARAISALRRVAPLASSTLRTGTVAAPEIRGLLRAARPFLPRLRGTLRQAAPQLSCIRPYAPEIVAFPQLWAGFAKNYDAQDHYARTMLQVQPYANGSPLTSEQVVATYPGTSYAFPRVPGLNAGQPWFLPECGAGQDALDPSQDPEARR